ncbi:MAG TPA: twin-arginine translocase subunit TatC, partial [Mycobacterium sp.]|uniref:twin-arginine translocase subunit TatC n=1 Tax=Mycobacterium sp. TaxID=1785 RepID=UPI002D57E5A1
PLIHLLNRALPPAVVGQHGLGAVPNQEAHERAGLQKIEHGAAALATAPGLSASGRAAAAQIARGAAEAAAALNQKVQTKEKPITIGVGEPFTTTLTVAAYFALLFSLPVLLFEAYGFAIPALNSSERRMAVPVMVAAPLLFLTGIVFAYVVVLPPAVHFLQGYNSAQFQVLVQAKAYFTFEILTMLGIGLAFQLPLGLLALHRIGVIDGGTLTGHWRYAIVIIAVVAAAMPGSDPVTTGLEALPLVLLFAVSIVLLKIADRRAAARAAAEATQTFDSGLETSL